MPCKRVAFTLAETLITLAIIGVVAAITIPSLVKNYNEKAWATAQSVFEKRLDVAVKQLNTEEKLAGYSSTMDFVNVLKTKIKITKVCDSSELTKCFENKIQANYKEIDITEFESGRQFTKENWGTETVGVQFANGVSALIAYNPDTKQEPYNNQFGAAAESMAILYDVSGHKNPNTLGKDVNQNANVKKLGCYIKPDLVGGMCISKILAPGTGYSPMTYEECTQAKENGEIDVDGCCGAPSGDYFAGAVKACGGKKNMPTETQLIELAKYVYNTDSINGGTSPTPGLTLDTDKVSQFPSVDDGFEVFSGQEYGRDDVYGRSFGLISTRWGTFGRRASYMQAVCLDQ